MPELNIPSVHHQKFRFYVTLPNELKQQINEQLRLAPVGLSPSGLVDFTASNVPKLSKERIADIYQIYFNLIRAKERLNVETPVFLEILAKSLSDTGIEELQPTPDVLNDFAQMLSNSNNTLITTKIIDLMTENQKTFVDAKIYQDIRPAFDDNDKLMGSVVVHNLKLFFKESDEIKEIYIALDNNDIDKIITLLKKAQEKLSFIKTHFDNANIIEIK